MVFYVDYSDCMSEITSQKMDEYINGQGLRIKTELCFREIFDDDNLMEYNSDYSFTPFKWGGQTENEGTPAALDHLVKEISRIRLASDQSGNNKLMCKDGFSCIDLHTKITLNLPTDGIYLQSKFILYYSKIIMFCSCSYN